MIFDLECPYCTVALVPVDGAVWGCPHCGTAFEMCGTRLVVRRDVRRARMEAGDCRDRCGTV